MMYWDAAFAVMVWEPIVMGPGRKVGMAGFTRGMGIVEVPMTSAGWDPEVWSARTVVDAPVPIVIVEPGARVWPWMMYCDAALGVMVWEPMVIGPGREGGFGMVVKGTARVEEPTMSCICELEVCRAKTVGEGPAPRVMVETGARVWPEAIYWEEGFAVMIWLPTVIGPGTVAGVGFGAGGAGYVDESMIIWVCPFEVCNLSKVVAISGPIVAPASGLAFGTGSWLIIEGGAFASPVVIVATAGLPGIGGFEVGDAMIFVGPSVALAGRAAGRSGVAPEK